jgi:hypothetical protein
MFKSLLAHTIGRWWPMLARICVANDICDRGMGVLETVGHDGWKTRTVRSAECRSLHVGQSALNFKRVRHSQRGCNPPSGEWRQSCPAEGGLHRAWLGTILVQGKMVRASW